jgi:hypothetical protein
MDEVIEWIGEGGCDPQGHIEALMRAHGHQPGSWYYAGREGPWQHEARACTRCGAVAQMGHRRGRPGWGQSTAMAVWGEALTTDCWAQGKKEG